MGKIKLSKVWGLLILVYIFFNFAYTSFYPFETMYLTHLGYKSSDVAILSMSTAIGNFLFQFLVSRFLKSQKRIGQVMTVFVALSIPLAFLLLLFHGSLFTVVLFVFPVTLFDFSCIGQLDGVTVALSKEHPEIEYSVTRVFGSLAGILSSFLLGHLYSSIGISWMFVIHGAVQLLTLITLLVMRKRFLSALFSTQVTKNDSGLTQSMPLIKKTLPILAGGTMIFLGWRAIFVYLPIMIENLGGTSADFGNAMAIINGSSMIIMLIYPLFRKKMGLRLILMVGSLAMALRWMLTALAPSLVMIILVQALDSFGFGFMQPAIIELITSSSDEKDRSSLITIWTGIQMALGTILANLMVQIFSPLLGLQLSFMGFAVMAIAGLIIICSTVLLQRTATKSLG